MFKIPNCWRKLISQFHSMPRAKMDATYHITSEFTFDASYLYRHHSPILHASFVATVLIIHQLPTRTRHTTHLYGSTTEPIHLKSIMYNLNSIIDYNTTWRFFSLAMDSREVHYSSLLLHLIFIYFYHLHIEDNM